ncbi:iron-containing alcohol dehydrogenase [Desulforamulus aquiferis]|uniref:Iron-containing alcohol dehydrogenase n=1 Tax=Desulforamulus aquiferis TaxID=1397668 RepID=A0AAW7ZFX6_9FIRM|nr:iron-containing alcohol dehydrogenase [Desulforamulus aquiferis]MDO7788182.1 iron-containing alcohol dehydrogenase [Desulforamulus aquiferis]
MITTSFNFKLPTEIEFGPGSLYKLPKFIADFKVHKVMIVTDPGIVKAGILERISNVLAQAKINCVVFDQVESDPSTKTIEKIRDKAKLEEVDALIAVGGGSSIDAAKGTRLLLSNEGKLLDYAGLNKVKQKGIPLIAIPTTAGTGSEVTIFAVLTELEQDIKFTIASPYLAPDLSILDPELTLLLPPMMTAATGLDALTHAIEAYTSQASQPICDVIALESIRLIYRYLPQATTDGNNLEARTEMLKAQLLAGIAFNNTNLGLSHAIASPLGGHFHIPHGIANAIMLPYVMNFNVPAAPERYAKITEAMGICLMGKDIYEDAYEAPLAIGKLVELCGLPKKLRDVGATEEKLDDVARDALKSGMLKFNIRKASEKQIRQILQEAF